MRESLEEMIIDTYMSRKSSEEEIRKMLDKNKDDKELLKIYKDVSNRNKAFFENWIVPINQKNKEGKASEQSLPEQTKVISNEKP